MRPSIKTNAGERGVSDVPPSRCSCRDSIILLLSCIVIIREKVEIVPYIIYNIIYIGYQYT